jgi:tetratricopeptide (TPR) repeat protein
MLSQTTLGLWHARAEAAHKAGNAQASLQAWLVIASAAPSDWHAWCNVANAAVRLERWADAAEAFERAAALNSRDAGIARNLGGALSNIGSFDKALAALKKAVALDPDNVQGRLGYARLLIDTGQYPQAMIEIEEGSRLALGRALADHRQPTTGEPAISILRTRLPPCASWVCCLTAPTKLTDFASC